MTATAPQQHDGWAEHAQAVAALRSSYALIPVGSPVRLAKRTSNLFRPRIGEPAVGLDVTALNGVISVDPAARTADVQGMCTYEHLVEATLPYGLMPLVVPQLRSITLGGAVTGLGIESSSFRNGLPHESVLELDILTGAGEIVTASRDQNTDLFAGFPNSYGSLGYAVRLKIELQPVHPYVALRHVRFTDLDELCAAIERISAEQAWDGDRVEFLDGVVFGPDEAYLSLGRWVDWPAEVGAHGPSDYTGQQIYYRSLQTRERDLLTIADYLWRWDTDWFWCSGAFGAQNPVVRRLWPARYRRSDFYYRLIRLEQRYGVGARLDRLKRIGARERVVQDVEIPLESTADFLRWFDVHVGMSPVWLCPLALRAVSDDQSTGDGDGDGTGDGHGASAGSAQPWPLYPLEPGRLYVNVGFWGTVIIAEGHSDGDVNRLVEAAVAQRDGHKSLYSDAYYERDTFEAMYGGATYHELKRRYDPDNRLTGLYEKAVGRR
ncbi:MAG: FAD-linked oxidase [Frankiales bacterium]|nr:FAD-linked oxidase [Frankiales bacterium]